MSRILPLTVLIGFAACVVVVAVADDLPKSERDFSVTYKDGAEESYHARWSASVVRGSESLSNGDPAKPGRAASAKGGCRWTVQGEIARKVYLKNRQGQFLEASSTTVYHNDPTKRETDFIIRSSDPGACDSTTKRQEADVASITSRLAAAFESVVAFDTKVLTQERLRQPGVTDVRMETGGPVK
ncbi:MAG: hypothetical protein ABI672_12400 [Vicinamibacteria bacterium]